MKQAAVIFIFFVSINHLYPAGIQEERNKSMEIQARQLFLREMKEGIEEGQMVFNDVIARMKENGETNHDIKYIVNNYVDYIVPFVYLQEYSSVYDWIDFIRGNNIIIFHYTFNTLLNLLEWYFSDKEDPEDYDLWAEYNFLQSHMSNENPNPNNNNTRSVSTKSAPRKINKSAIITEDVLENFSEYREEMTDYFSTYFSEEYCNEMLYYNSQLMSVFYSIINQKTISDSIIDYIIELYEKTISMEVPEEEEEMYILSGLGENWHELYTKILSIMYFMRLETNINNFNQEDQEIAKNNADRLKKLFTQQDWDITVEYFNKN